MLVASLSLLIALLTGGGSDIPVFIVDDLSKEIKNHVNDKEKKKEILSVLKDYEKEFKKSQKSLGKEKKQLKKLNTDRNSPEGSMDIVLNDASEIWSDLKTSAVQKRVEVQGLLTEEEWQNIIAESLAEMNKKEIKSQEKAYKEFDKNFDKLKKGVTSEITDPERLKIIEETFKNFKDLWKIYLDEVMALSLRYLDSFQNLDATEAELNEAISSVGDSRDNLFDGIIKLNAELKELTTDEEWTTIAKKINKLF